MSLSSTASVSAAASPSAPSNCVPSGHGASVKGRRLRRRAAVGADHDLVDAGLRFAQLRLAVALQQRAPLIGGDRFAELAAAALEPLHDLLELLQRLLKA